MTYDLFVDLMNKLSGWTNKKMNEVQREVYWNEINRIPDMPFEHIIDDLIKNTPPSGKLPTPDQISLQWFHWLQSHPNFKQAEYPQTECAECDGEGCFSVWYQDSPIPIDERHLYADIKQVWYKKFLPCSQCQNWRRVFPTKGNDKPSVFYTKQIILEKGWRLTDPYLERYLEIKKSARKQIEETRDLNQLAEETFDNKREAVAF